MLAGHGHPAVVKAVQKAASRALSFGAPTEAEVELAELLAAGVDAIAVITALFEAGDVEQRARALRDLFARIESP